MNQPSESLGRIKYEIKSSVVLNIQPLPVCESLSCQEWIGLEYQRTSQLSIWSSRLKRSVVVFFKKGCLPFKVFTLSFSIGVQSILWECLSHLLHKWSVDVTYLLGQPGRPSWWGRTGDIRTCRSLHSRSPLGSTITQGLLVKRSHIGLIIDSVLYPL